MRLKDVHKDDVDTVITIDTDRGFFRGKVAFLEEYVFEFVNGEGYFERQKTTRVGFYGTDQLFEETRTVL